MNMDMDLQLHLTDEFVRPQLIVCIDFTKSNEVNGKCFGGACSAC